MPLQRKETRFLLDASPQMTLTQARNLSSEIIIFLSDNVNPPA